MQPPSVGAVLTVFRSRLEPGAQDTYGPHAAAMGALAAGMPGYVEHKVFTADDGERVTVVTFADQASHDAWRDHAEHRAAQRAGVAGYYAEYSVQVATVTRASTYTRAAS